MLRIGCVWLCICIHVCASFCSVNVALQRGIWNIPMSKWQNFVLFLNQGLTMPFWLSWNSVHGAGYPCLFCQHLPPMWLDERHAANLLLKKHQSKLLSNTLRNSCSLSTLQIKNVIAILKLYHFKYPLVLKYYREMHMLKLAYRINIIKLFVCRLAAKAGWSSYFIWGDDGKQLFCLFVWLLHFQLKLLLVLKVSKLLMYYYSTVCPALSLCGWTVWGIK